MSIGVVVVSSLCSGLWAANVDRLNESVLTDDTKRIEGAIMDVVSIDGSQVSFLLRSYEGEKIQSFIRLSNEEDLEFGETMQSRGHVVYSKANCESHRVSVIFLPQL
ncbi:hypothetical protein [Geomicrobium sp. JCM 19037]|uniref:hypothetical protein n=1 Tax=Geomicrobium sp. JCM 19037 TaxID=1460634 RepID=UPI001267F187|nr:hypothetical protein [Geomicrobium sp. JCM 19037]